MNILVEEKLISLNKVIMQEAPAVTDQGLFHGKLGISIYFFHLAKQTGDSTHQDFAEKLLDEVYEGIQNQSVTCGFGSGLAGIAWGLDYLIKEKFVEADVDEVLEEADHKIFHYLVNASETGFGLMDGMLGYLAYLICRLRPSTGAAGENYFIFNRLLVDVLNRMSAAIEGKTMRLEEPPFFNLNWDLPLFLILLGKCLRLQLHRNKIDRIIASLSPSILSYIPCLQGNRLYLFFGMQSILPQSKFPPWEKQALFIRQHLDWELLLEQELKEKQLHLYNGLAGVSFLVHHLNGLLIQKDPLIIGGILERILYSDHLNTILQNKPEVKTNPGLINGLAGIGLQLLLYLNNIPLTKATLDLQKS